IGYGVLGLIDSIDKFDITKDIKFETYAQIRIKGAIIDNIRKLDWIPRSLRKKSKDIQITISTLENRLGRSPSNAEIAYEMGIEEDNLDLLLSDISTFNMSSLEEMIYSVGDYFTKSESLDSPEDIYEKSEIVKILEKSIEILNKSEKLVITLYYYEELTYKEIGEVMDLSESRISQIHSKAILKMKNNLMKQGIDNYS
ncbi:MAG: FliA/WhiG family RNA polymerase sigma factor, partial [Tissierellia bacterium]|nr:FliA/WhiG family RNA polymerase sigma factor [Tissierellia bacterium]